MLYLNDHEIVPTRFPDGTSQIWKIDFDTILTHKGTAHVIRMEYHSEADIINLMQLKMLLDSLDLKKEPILSMEYLPYARQDKDVDNNTCFALRAFAKIINLLDFNKVAIMDAHSEIAEEVIDNFYGYFPMQMFSTLFVTLDSFVICYPDGGALEKYKDIYSNELEEPVVYAEKTRNALTGEITHMRLYGDVRDKSVLIVDDICDGGATFTRLASLLYAEGATEVNLFVAHGIFSKGLDVLFNAGIKRVFTHKGEALKARDGNGIKYRRIDNV